MNIVDEGHKQTDELLAELEKKISREYDSAAKAVQKKLEDHLKAFERKDKVKKELLKSGKITEAEYKQWRLGQIMIGKRWEEMEKTLATDLTNADKLATSMINGYMPEVYALNHDYGTFDVERGSMMDTSYTLYDRQTVERLIRDNPDLLPSPKVDIAKDLRWNKQHINSAITQGILTGESIPDIAKRLRSVTDMDKRASIRNARTMTTSAENAGRLDSYKRARDMGLNFKQQWRAMLDFRTRYSHRELDGELIEVGGVFSNGCKCPGDPDGEPAEVYNCRCTMKAVFEGINDNASDLMSRNSKLGDMSYEEWKGSKVTLTKAEQDAFNKSSVRNVDEFKQTTDFKKIHNAMSDKEQFARYKETLKVDVPTSFSAFQSLKYDTPEEWRYTKGLYRYIRKYPNSSKVYYDVGLKLKEQHLVTGVVLPPVQKTVYLSPSPGRNPNHIFHRMAERNITEDDLKSYMLEAKCMIVQWNGQRQLFFSEKGECVICKDGDMWKYKTAWKRSDFNENSEKILEVLKDAGL